MMRICMALLLMVCSLTAMGQTATDDVAETDKAMMARAEKMFGFLLDNQADSLYENMSDQVKPMVQRQQFENLLSYAESQTGKYQSHGPWEVQQQMGYQCYVSMVSFERAQLGVVVIFDKSGKMLGMQMVSPDAVKKE